MEIRYTTFADAVAELIDYLGASVGDSVLADAKRCVLAGYRRLTRDNNWTAYYTQGRIDLNGPFPGASAGGYPSVSFDKTGGTYENQLTMDDPPSGTDAVAWPTWAEHAYIRIANVVYRVDRRISDTVLTLREPLVPTSDLPAGTVWSSFYQDTYLLPADFASADKPVYEINFWGLLYQHPREWIAANRMNEITGDPRWYTIVGDNKYPTDRLTMKIFPHPSQSRTIDFLYQRSARPLVVHSLSTGTVACTAGSKTITGTDTVWLPSHVGSVIRISSSRTEPTPLIGKNPAVYESIIRVVTSATSIICDDESEFTLSNVAHVVSDPIDISDTAMRSAFMRACEHEMQIKRVLQDKPSAKRLYEEALAVARDADSPTFAMRSVGDKTRGRTRLARMPYDNTGGNVYDAGGS